MNVAVFSSKPYDRRFLEAANLEDGHRLTFLETRLSRETVTLAGGAEAICPFVNDDLGAGVMEELAGLGVRLLALRSAGFNHVDLEAAARHRIVVARVPAYSPHAVAEHTVALILTLNRKIHRAYNRVREGNFALDGLLGFDLHGKTAGVVGTGLIGQVVARILTGFGCTVLAHDPAPAQACLDLGVRYVALGDLLAESDVVTLHCPLTPATHHLIGTEALGRMKKGAMLVNTSRGAVIDTKAVIRGLKDGTIGSLGLDVYEEEADLFFEDLSGHYIQDDLFARLLTFPNVLITGHQAFFTEEALGAIAATTLGNITAFATTGRAVHEVHADQHTRRA
jgi:D-lactate dehydrogenase